MAESFWLGKKLGYPRALVVLSDNGTAQVWGYHANNRNWDMCITIPMTKKEVTELAIFKMRLMEES